MHDTENDANVPENNATQSDDAGDAGNSADLRRVPAKVAGDESRLGDRSGPQRAAADDGEAAGLEESMIDETLHHALSDLEQILEQRQGTANAGNADQRAGEARVDEDTDQYTIPLLDEIVRPGNESQVAPAPISARQPQADPDSKSRDKAQDDSEPALRRRLAERLASEIEIITQDRIEAALEKAHEEIRVQVRNHLDIILPEVVEELSQVRRRRGSEPEH